MRHVPSFVQWSFGRTPFVSPVAARSVEFSYGFTPTLEPGEYSFPVELRRACERLDQRRAGKTIALCYSGGTDSELIARQLFGLGIPFELYFLDIWGINREVFTAFAPVVRSLTGKKVREVRLEKIPFYEGHSLEAFRRFGCELPTPLALSYLFTQIPKDQFIVVGDGDLNRAGGLFRLIAEKHAAPAGRALPTSVASVFYYLWAEAHEREGEFYFFSSTPELVASVLQSPHFQCDYPLSQTSALIRHHFPEIQPRAKTTNWDGGAYQENQWIRTWLENHAKKWPEFSFWEKSVGTILRPEEIFKSRASRD